MKKIFPVKYCLLTFIVLLVMILEFMGCKERIENQYESSNHDQISMSTQEIDSEHQRCYTVVTAKNPADSHTEDIPAIQEIYYVRTTKKCWAEMEEIIKNLPENKEAALIHSPDQFKQSEEATISNKKHEAHLFVNQEKQKTIYYYVNDELRGLFYRDVNNKGYDFYIRKQNYTFLPHSGINEEKMNCYIIADYENKRISYTGIDEEKKHMIAKRYDFDFNLIEEVVMGEASTLFYDAPIGIHKVVLPLLNSD